VGAAILVLMAAPGRYCQPAAEQRRDYGAYVLCAVVVAMATSGLAVAKKGGLFDIVFGGSGAALPVDFSHIAPCAAHGVLAIVLFRRQIG